VSIWAGESSSGVLSPRKLITSRPFIPFRLGSQKYKSRTVSRTAVPKWLEQFDLYLYEGQPQVLEVQIYDEAFSRDYIGRCSVDVGLLEKETTHHITLPLQEGPGQISLLLTISGTSGTETISDLTNYNPSPEEVQTIQSRYVRFGFATNQVTVVVVILLH